MPQIKPVRPSLAGSVFHDKDQDDYYDANGEEPIITEDGTRTRRNWFFTTPLLTVWRHLFIERDAMRAPDDPVSQYGFDADDPDPGGALPLPDTSLFPDAFDTSFILPVNLPAAPPSGATKDMPSETHIPFQRHFANEIERDAFLSVWRDTLPEDPNWWTVYIVGIYEEFAFLPHDNDDDDETGVPGRTVLTEPEYAMIFNEVIRDLGAEHDQEWNNPQDTDWVRAIVALHEVGHQFGLAHAGHTFPDDLMRPPSPSQEDQMPEHQPHFTELDIKTIRAIWGL